mmetsp:Transcript_6330/g.8298  ORF Transcript_6330/g.8298 Transcript_6330/m.8298 type:complete len:136 (+) Transcript_6330:110-517(+)
MSGRWGKGIKTLESVDLHADGEPARVIVGGMPPVPGATMLEKREYLMKNLDFIRKLLITEPRGYPCQNANVIFPVNQEYPKNSIGECGTDKDMTVQYGFLLWSKTKYILQCQVSKGLRYLRLCSKSDSIRCIFSI